MRAYFFPRLVLGALALSLSTSAIAVTVDSTFLRGPDNPYYSDPANWSPSQVPDNSGETTYNVTVRDATVYADINATISNFILAGGSAIKVEASNLTVTGTTLNIATTLSIPILVINATFDAGSLSTFSNDTLTGKYWIYAAKNTVAALKFNGANVVKLQNAELSLVGAGGARVLDEQGHDGMRNLEEIDSASWFTLSGQDFVSGATFSNYGRLILTASFDGPGTTFTIPGAFTNFDLATHTLNGGIYELENSAGVTTPLILRFNGADIVSNAASVSIGPNGAIEDLAGNDALRNFRRNTATGDFALIGRNFTTGGDFTNDGRLQLVYSVFTVTGALTNWNPSTATLTGGVYEIMGGVLKFNGANIVHNAASISLAQLGRIEDENGNDGLRHFVDNQAGGTFTVGVDHSFSASGDFTNAGTVVVQGFEVGIPELTPGRLTIPPGHVYNQSGGETRVGGNLDSDLTAISGGVLSGFGAINGDVSLGSATLHPGNGLRINGSLSLSATSHFVAGVGRIVNDHMSVSGSTALAGELMIEISNEFPIGSTDTFTILTSGSPFTGSFSNVASGDRLVSIDGNGSFRVTYAGNQVTLSDFVAEPPSAQLVNISTRTFVSPGNHALIGGFIITGTEPKKVIVRGIGPSLAQVGVGGSLQDPKIELRDSAGALIAANDNWRDTQESEIKQSGLAPHQDAESAIIATLTPGAHTIILRGQNDFVGVGLVEVYDLGITSKLANVSTRGSVDANNVLIAGFIAGGAGSGADEIVLRAIGPDLQRAGVLDPLPDPTLELRDHNGQLIASNDDWEPDTVVGVLGLRPRRLEESVLRATLIPGSYTALVRGKGNDSGTALVEVYDLHR